jgi:Circadian oscillating protein COP23
MTARFFAYATVATTLVTGAAMVQPSPAQASDTGFFCDTSSGTPVTIYRNRQSSLEPWIRWVSNTFSASGYTPEARCQEVSGRLETYRRNRQLKFITVGYMNRQRVVCTASQVNGRCEGLIFTLKPGQDAVRTLNNLLAWREGQAATPSLAESGEVPYIDVRSRLGEDAPAAAESAPRPQPGNVTPSSSEGLREL